MAKYRGKHSYMSAWNYVLLDILYAIPVIGVIFLVAHAVNNSNENRLHYARAFMLRFLLGLLICGVMAGLFYLAVGSEIFIDKVEETTQLVKDYVNTLVPPQS